MPSKPSVEGDVRAVGRGGDAVVETPNGVVLVPGALPGERIELSLTSSKRGAARGHLTRVLPDTLLAEWHLCESADKSRLLRRLSTFFRVKRFLYYKRTIMAPLAENSFFTITCKLKV